MPATLVIGALYGDEGKGRVSHALAPAHDLSVRFNGGANAKHTVVHRGRRHHLHLLPAGVLHRGHPVLLGPGMLVDPFKLLDELAEVDPRRVHVAREAALVLPHHVERDREIEELRGDALIGTTRQGVGPALADKARRIALRVEDLLDDDRIAAYHEARDLWERTRTHPSAKKKLARALREAGDRLAPRMVAGGAFVREALAGGRRVLVEGAQGTLLDVDHGTWPHVTATHPTAGGALASLGVPPRAVRRTIGVTRAYATRQGTGAFPTELAGFEEGALRAATKEHSVRIGWLDAVALRLAHAINGFDELVITGADTLAPIDRPKICVDHRGPRYEDLPNEPHALARTVEALTGVPVRWISTAPGGPLVRVKRVRASPSRRRAGGG